MELRRKIDGAVFNLPKFGNPDIRMTNNGRVFSFTPAELIEEFTPFECDLPDSFNDSLDESTESADSDPVSRPDHYCNGGIECIDAMAITFGKKWVIIFCKLNAFKYRWRAPFKGKMQEDLKKAEWYLNKAEELENENCRSK